MPLEVSCPLCDTDGGLVVLRAAHWRIVLADDADHPAFTRVVWNAHCAEMSDLDENARSELVDVVLRVESVQRKALRPDKINLASLGNQVPHLHWHVIPRWRDDRHFPNAVWGAERAEGREQADVRTAAVRARLDDYVVALQREFGASVPDTGRSG